MNGKKIDAEGGNDMAKQQAAYLMGPLNFCPICGFTVNEPLSENKKTVGDFVDWAKRWPRIPAVTVEIGSKKVFVGKKTITTWKKLRGKKPETVKRVIKLFKNEPEEHNICGFCRQQVTDKLAEFINPGVNTTGETPIDVPPESQPS